MDEYVDALVEVWRYLESLDSAQVHSYAAVARVHCRTRVVRDLRRQRLGARSQQRTDRLADGAIGRALRTPAQRALLRHVVEEAASSAPLEDEAQLLRRLALRRAAETGEPAEDVLVEVARDLQVVRQAAIAHGRRQRDGAGMLVSWWEFYVETGLGWRERLSTIPIATTAVDGAPGVDVADDSLRELSDAVSDAAVVRELTDAVRVPAGRPLVEVVGERLRLLADEGAIPITVSRAVLSDPQRLLEVVGAARALVGEVA